MLGPYVEDLSTFVADSYPDIEVRKSIEGLTVLSLYSRN